MRLLFWFVLLGLMLTACTATAEMPVSPPATTPETAVLPTSTAPPPIITTDVPRVDPATAVPNPTATATTAAEPTAETAVAATGVISGRTDEGAFFLGDPNAPITHIDYSDFL